MKEVKEETSARRKLRNFLVLLSRLFALACLIFAFAQPFLPQNSAVKKGEKSVSVFIDNSFSMSSLSEDVPLIEKAKQRAREIISAYNVEDRFQILTNDFEGRHQRLVSKEDALSLVDEVKISPSVKEMSKIVTRQEQALNSGTTDNKTAYIISDFQKNITDVQTFQDTLIDTNLVPLQSVQEKNISLDSAWFDAPVQMMNQTNTLVVRVKNQSSEDAENIRLSLKHEGQTKPIGTLNIPARSISTDTVNITILKTGWHEAELNITDYPVQFDDKYYFTFNVAEIIKVLIINDGNPNNYLNAAFQGAGYFQVKNQSSKQLDYSKFAEYDLIVGNDLLSISSGLGSELKKYVTNGGNLTIFPAANANISSFQSFLQNMSANELQAFEKQERTVADINTEEFIFSDVYENRNAALKLPVTSSNFKMSSFASRGQERLLTYRDGSPFLSKYQLDQGNFYLCAAPLNEKYNNLVRNGEVFIPMLYKMAISSAKDKTIAHIIGQDEVIQADNFLTGSETVYKLKGQSEEFIPEQKIIGSKVLLGINNQIKEAGFYNLFLDQNETLSKYAYNYDRKESKLEYLNSSDLKDLGGDNVNIIDGTAEANLTPIIGERSQGTILWRWFLIAALVFLAIEVLLLRFWEVK